MPSASPSQRPDEIYKTLETLRAQSLSHSEKAVETSAEAIGEILVGIGGLTIFAGEGTIENEGDASIEDKPTCKAGGYLSCKRILLKVRANDGQPKLCLTVASNQQLKPQAKFFKDSQINLYGLQVPQE